MLSIDCQLADGGMVECLIWHVGKTVPQFVTLPREYKAVFVTASGREHDAVTRVFGNMRRAKGPFVRWHGDDALFIVHNIRALDYAPKEA